MQAFLIHEKDNVSVALTELKESCTIEVSGKLIKLLENIPRGHKIAINDIKQGEDVIKYGYPIGTATKNIKKGAKVDESNIKTKLGDILSYTYSPLNIQDKSPYIKDSDKELTFLGYQRQNGDVGTRNEVWIIPTVFCINNTAVKLREIANDLVKDYKNVDGVFAFPHHFGCSQMGKDHQTTQQVLKGLVNHPNAAAVLIVGLGCENNNIEEFKQVLKNFDENRVRFLNTQDIKGNELEAGTKLLKELLEYANQFKRQTCSISKLRLGLKCGSSDGLSGITANPMLGTLTDRISNLGGSVVMTEVPEMFGAEQVLMNRAKDQKVFEEIVALINNFKQYYISHGEIISDNPSPGNKKGGISTLEEKSLGCLQKGGHAIVNGVLQYAQPLRESGFYLLQSPGNDGVSTTALAVSGCTIIVYSTGRGTPFGTAVPGIKISSNNNLALNKPNWIDFNAGVLIDGKDKKKVSDDLLNKLIRVASGENTQDEIHGFKEINIWKDGVTL